MKFTKANILFENNQFYILIKPQNIPIQSDGKSTSSLMQALEDYLEFGLGIEDPFLGLVHRLDRHTGGLCVIAKNEKALKKLNQLFSTRKVSKKYLTIVKGRPPESDRLTHYLTVNHKTNFVKVDEVAVPDAKEAILSYKCLGFNDSELGPQSLLEITLETGRQHQIRAQLAHIGYPVLGDPKYGTCPIPGESLALWAYSLIFDNFEFKALPVAPYADNQYFLAFDALLKSFQK